MIFGNVVNFTFFNLLF